MKKNQLIILIVLLTALGVYFRLAPHPANFTPLGALALISGVYLPKKWSVIFPLALLFFTDLFLGFYAWPVMLTVYACFALTALAGLYLRRKKNFLLVITSSLAMSLLFFLATNFAVWAASNWYPRSMDGLILSYTLAVPFFRNSLLGDLFFTGVLFGLLELARFLLRQKFWLKKCFFLHNRG